MPKKINRRSLLETHPQIAAMWHPTKNGDLTPQDVSYGMADKVWWFYPYDDPKTGHHDFEWDDRIKDLVQKKGACPYLTGARVWPGYNDLATTHPEIAGMWHPTLNGERTPYDVSHGEHDKIWWFYPYDDPETGRHIDFKWQDPVYITVRNGPICPFVIGRRRRLYVGFNDLATKCPELAKEWDYERNEKTPQEYMPGARDSVYWIKKGVDPETGKEYIIKKWPARISSRAIRGDDCLNESHGEKFVAKHLKRHKIRYETQKTFKNMLGVGNRNLSFDFYLAKYKTAIEYQGIQHYKPKDHFGGGQRMERQKANDEIKRKYCKDNGIRLIEVPYTEDTYDKIDEFLKNELLNVIE